MTNNIPAYYPGRPLSDTDRVLAAIKVGRWAARAVPSMGELCGGVECGDLEDEHGISDRDTMSCHPTFAKMRFSRISICTMP